MKLLLCPHCNDVRKLRVLAPAQIEDLRTDTRCLCGKSWGYYTDNINAVYGGDAIMLGFSNQTLERAIDAQRKDGDPPNQWGRTFAAFVIPESAPTVKRETPCQ